MKNYLKPEIEAVELEKVDIICTSTLENVGAGGEDENGNSGTTDGVIEF